MALLERLFGDDGESTREQLERLQDAANDRLRDELDLAAAGVDPVEYGVTGAAVVNEGPDEEPVVVPIARFALGEDVETLDRDAAWPLVPDALRALHAVFPDEVFVRHYDVQFTYDGDELFEAEQCDRVAATPDTVGRLVGETGFDGAALREYVEREDDIDDEIAPVAWRDAMDYGRSNSAVVVTSAAVGASAASCAGASAGAGACGAAGGV